MKTLLMVGLLLAQLPASVRQDGVLIPEGFLTGEQYLKSFNDVERAAYSMGFLNGMLVSPMIPPNSTEEWTQKLQACIAKRTNTQYAEIIRRYIDADPKRWNERLNILSFLAVRESCNPN